MNEVGQKEQDTNSINNKINKEESQKEIEDIPQKYIIIDKILLITSILFNIFTFLLFGWNHLILFTATITILFRIYFGVKDKKAYYFLKGLSAFIMCFTAFIIKILFRLIMSCIANRDDEENNFLKRNFFETNHIFWIKGFDIKINGLGFIIFFLAFLALWITMIIFFNFQKKWFASMTSKNSINTYSNLIDSFYEEKNKNQQ